MTDADSSFVLEMLKCIQADVTDLKHETLSIRVKIASIGQQLGALTTVVYSGKSEMDNLKRRIERIERRLEISDTN